jgi:hypothetical protein
MSCSLTAPWDKDATTGLELRSPVQSGQKYTPKQVVLSEEQVASAMETLRVNDFVEKFPRVDKFYADPAIASQVYGLHSFVPAKGARPDEKGVYGFVKFRGAFATQQEADERAEFLIRNVDSFHDIYTSFCGRPFPISHNKDFVKETAEVDVRDQIVKATSEDVAAKVKKDRQLKDEVLEREKKLIEDCSKEESPLDRYTTLQVKRANTISAILEARKKLDKWVEGLAKCREEIKQLDDTDPTHRDSYIEKYLAAREGVGMPSTLEGTYLQFMGMSDDEIVSKYNI